MEYLRLMDTTKIETDLGTPAEHKRRLAWEAERIAEAGADVAAGRLVDEVDADSWIDRLVGDAERPAPYAKV